MRKPKDLQPEKIKAFAGRIANTSFDFVRIQQALRSVLSKAGKANIEFIVAYAIERERQRQLDVTPSDVAKFLRDVANRATFLAECIAPSSSNERGKKLKRHLRLTVERNKPKLNVAEMATDLRALAKEAGEQVERLRVLAKERDEAKRLTLRGVRKCRPKRLPLRGVRRGRPTSNDNWSELIRALADIFERSHHKSAGISFSTGTPTGWFHEFVLAVFAGISDKVRPSNTAIVTLIKPTLMRRKSDRIVLKAGL